MYRPMGRVVRSLLASLSLLFVLVHLPGCGGGGGGSSTSTSAVVPEPKEKGCVLKLVEGTTAELLSCKLSKHVKKDEDHVRWVNETTGPVTITFTAAWPFMEENLTRSFTVAAGESSPYYTLNIAVPNAAYPYQTTPPLVPSGTGQGEPTISVGD